MPELTHPSLPDRVITVAERAVHIHELAGWVRSAIKDLTAHGERAVRQAERFGEALQQLTTKSSPAEPVNPEQATDPLDLTNKEN